MSNTINTNYGSGGAPLSPTTDDTKQPALATVLRGIADDLDAIVNNGVVEGMMLDDPTTASTQLTGTGNTTWNVNIDKGVVVVDGVSKEFAAQADYSIHAASFLTGFINGTSAITAIVAKNVAGTVTMDDVTGTPATTGTQVAPTDAEITAAIGAANTWTKIGECLLNRTADTAVTESQDNTKRHGAVGAAGFTLSLLKGTV